MHVLCVTQPAHTAPIICGNVFVVDHMMKEQPGDLCGFRASGRSPVELGCEHCEHFFNLVGYVSYLPCMHTRLVDLEPEPTSDWQCFHAFSSESIY